MKLVIALVSLVLIVLFMQTCSYQVDGTRDICIITTFGEITGEVHGSEDPGLHLKWPWPIQGLVRYDFREQVLETALHQFTIAENNNITARYFCTWKIKDAQKFHSSKRGDSTAEIEAAIQSQLASDMKSVMGSKRIEQLVNIDPKEMRELLNIEKEVSQRLNKSMGERFGVEISSVGIHSLNVTKSVSEAVIKSMISERERQADEYRYQGNSIASAIEGRAKGARDKIIALANARAAEIRAQGEAAAAEYYSRFKADPDFAVFLRSVEALRKGLKQRAVFVLDSNVMPVISRFWDRSGSATTENQK